ncbi:MAG TPA: type II toxin-antitoxin system YafQ family toxin [Candidatus Pacearchaeota archaeon]|nr:type II toxin-antitoxin system YafQ family toxin [Candidatus Pacearchaeota archaeon]HPR79629.1 type II toxin-antitoxin system YafQ family toxin [Candidatus Pacearchaeota archaeon]
MEIKFNKNFIKRFNSSPLLIKRNFEDKFNLFLVNKFNPLLNNHSLRGKYSQLRSINITGDWRAIFRDDGNVVVFLTLGNHNNLYK